MSPRIERIEVEGPPRVFVRLPAGEARVVAGDEGLVEVRISGRDSVVERFLVARRGDQVVVEPEGGRFSRWSSVDIELRVGSDADVHARLAAGDVVVATDIAALTVEAGSGDVEAGTITGDARLKTAAGDIRATTVGGRLDVATASGDVRVGTVANDINAKAASGDIQIGVARASLVAHTASGDIEVERYEGDQLEVKTLSGDVFVGVPGGRTFAVDFSSLSGDVLTDFPVASGGGAKGTTARLGVKTMSGDIVVRPAR